MGVPIVILAGLISFLLTPLVAKIAFRFDFLDQPDHRKVHLKPTPLLGGLAIYLAAVLSFLFYLVT